MSSVEREATLARWELEEPGEFDNEQQQDESAAQYGTYSVRPGLDLASSRTALHAAEVVGLDTSHDISTNYDEEPKAVTRIHSRPQNGEYEDLDTSGMGEQQEGETYASDDMETFSIEEQVEGAPKVVKKKRWKRWAVLSLFFLALIACALLLYLVFLKPSGESETPKVVFLLELSQSPTTAEQVLFFSGLS